LPLSKDGDSLGRARRRFDLSHQDALSIRSGNPDQELLFTVGGQPNHGRARRLSREASRGLPSRHRFSPIFGLGAGGQPQDVETPLASPSLGLGRHTVTTSVRGIIQFGSANRD
jgi:hypothetical protein